MPMCWKPMLWCSSAMLWGNFLPCRHPCLWLPMEHSCLCGTTITQYIIDTNTISPVLKLWFDFIMASLLFGCQASFLDVGVRHLACSPSSRVHNRTLPSRAGSNFRQKTFAALLFIQRHHWGSIHAVPFSKTKGVSVVGMILVHILPWILSLLAQTTAAGGFGEKFHAWSSVIGGPEN